jgi:hypothetical protein
VQYSGGPQVCQQAFLGRVPRLVKGIFEESNKEILQYFFIALNNA